MSKVLHTVDIQTVLINQLKKTKNNIIILTAFCKLNALKFIEENLSNEIKSKKIIVRLTLNDIRTKSTDLEIYNFCKKHNWDLYFNFSLHSKVYLFDNNTVIIGSANLTSKGLCLCERGNIESVIIKNNITIEELSSINKILKMSHKMTDIIYNKMVNIISNNSEYNQYDVKWEDVILWLANNKNYNQIWVDDLIFSVSPYILHDHDINLLNLKDINNINNVKEKFEESTIFKWLLSVVKGEVYFGELAQILHNSIVDDPSLYRKNVKEFLNNIFNWIEILNIKHFDVDKPNYSKRIRPYKVNK